LIAWGIAVAAPQFKGALSYAATKADPAVDGTKVVDGVVLVARLGVTVVNWFVAVVRPDVPTG